MQRSNDIDALSFPSSPSTSSSSFLFSFECDVSCDVPVIRGSGGALRGNIRKVYSSEGNLEWNSAPG